MKLFVFVLFDLIIMGNFLLSFLVAISLFHLRDNSDMIRTAGLLMSCIAFKQVCDVVSVCLRYKNGGPSTESNIWWVTGECFLSVGLWIKAYWVFKKRR